jgi:hypothetical protein
VVFQPSFQHFHYGRHDQQYQQRRQGTQQVLFIIMAVVAVDMVPRFSEIYRQLTSATVDKTR